MSDTLDTLDENEIFEDEEAEAEVDAILGEIIGTKLNQTAEIPLDLPPVSNTPVKEDVEEEDEDEELLNSMRERLRALQS